MIWKIYFIMVSGKQASSLFFFYNKFYLFLFFGLCLTPITFSNEIWRICYDLQSLYLSYCYLSVFFKVVQFPLLLQRRADTVIMCAFIHYWLMMKWELVSQQRDTHSFSNWIQQYFWSSNMIILNFYCIYEKQTWENITYINYTSHCKECSYN